MVLNLQYRLIMYLMFGGTRVQTWVWKTTYNWLYKGQSVEMITAINFGYSLLSDNGVYLEKYKDNFEVL